MKKKILCLILVTLMLISSLPLAVLADEIIEATPAVIVTSQYYYDDGRRYEFRALPDNTGNFYLDIALDRVPENDENIRVYYRTIDDSAVAAWGDYESVGAREEAFVTLNKSNGYKVRVVITSVVMENGFFTPDPNGVNQSDKIITRRFLFELTRVEGNARLYTPKTAGDRDQSEVYCYLRANEYCYQSNFGKAKTSAWQSNMKNEYWADMQDILDYYWDNDPSFGPEHMVQFWDQVQDEWSKGTADVKYESFYYSTNSATALNTSQITYKGKYSDSINIKLSEEWHDYAATGVCDLGISINGIIKAKKHSHGGATFNLYYNYQGEKRLALTLYLEGKFDDSNFFGWEHAYEYAVEGLTEDDRKDHMEDVFIGYTLYDNDGNVFHEIKMDESRSSSAQKAVCEALEDTLIEGQAVKMMAEYNELTDNNKNFTAYYLRLPSNFALADSYSYEFISDSTNPSETRWLENVKVSFSLISNKEPMIAKHSNGNQMVTTNIDAIKDGDKLQMSVRFDRPVYIDDSNFHITADLYNDKGTCLAKGVKLKLKPFSDAINYYYAWDTLVFECEMPEGAAEAKLASIRNIKFSDDGGPIRSFFTNFALLNKTIKDIYIEKDFRTPVATVSAKSTDNWVRSKSLDIYVNVKGNTSARFADYATVYYQWSNSTDLPETYGSKLTFNTNVDGEVLKTIIGTGNGQLYLHVKTVSSYGKSSISDAKTVVYDPDDESATYTPFGPFKFDNAPPVLSENDILITGTLKERTISFPMPDDNNGSGFRELSLYYIDESEESKLLKKFNTEDFSVDTQTVDYVISHKTFGIGVDENGNVISDRGQVELYWIISDKIGNTTDKTAGFSLAFDTNDYIVDEISAVGPYDTSSESTDAQFKKNTEKIDDSTFIYNYKPNNGKAFNTYLGSLQNVYYAFSFTVDHSAFGETDSGTYGADVYYKGEKITNYTVVEDGVGSGVYVVLFHASVGSGRYDIQLTRLEGGSKQLSYVYTVYATDSKDDATEIRTKVEAGTLLNNSVYQLSADNPYFYYKDANGAIQKVYYNDSKQPATFSSFEKAKEYAYYKELGDIYLIKLTTATANALISGTTGYLKAVGETVTPQEGQYWIRYKSMAWTPTSGDSSWVYYYYGMSGELYESSLSSNLQLALNAVATRIASYGRYVVLTDTSLFLGTVTGEKMLDSYGMPYLSDAQVHVVDEISDKTMCGNVWGIQVAFAADKNIYKSDVYVGVEGTADYREYPIVGFFQLPTDSRFQFVTYAEYHKINPAWQELNIQEGQGFINVLSASGVYYIRELSVDGVAVYAIYIDKEAPKVIFSNTDDKGDLKDIPIDGVDIVEIRTRDLYIGGISAVEYDRLSYIAIYKASDLSLVSIYTATDLDYSPVKLNDGNYYIVVADRSGNHYTITAKISSSELECQIKESPDRFIRLTCNRRSNQILRYEVYLNSSLVTSTYSEENTFDKAGLYTIYIQDIYGNVFYEEYLFTRNYPTVTWKFLGTDGKYHTYDPDSTGTNGFILTWVSDNQYKISSAVKTRFSFSEGYGFEFLGVEPQYTKTLGAETVVTIEAGQSFTLKVYYKNHPDCYVIYSGIVDVTPPSVSVSAEVDILSNGEESLFDDWIEKDLVTMDDIYYVLSEISRRSVSNGGTISSDIIRINASDANNLFSVDVYLDGNLINSQNATSGFSQIVVSQLGKYRIVAVDALGNVAEFTFTNGMPRDMVYYVDGVEKELELHGYLNFEAVGNKHVYNKVDYGNTALRLDISKNADVFMSVSVSGGTTVIYGYRIADGRIYPLTYKIVLDNNSNKTVETELGEAVLDVNVKGFKAGQEYLISKEGAHQIYASVSTDNVVSIKVYASEDTSKIVFVNARVEFSESNIMFVSAEISKKSSDVTFKDIEGNELKGTSSSTDIRVNSGFTVDESFFESERIEGVNIYYSRLNDIDMNKLAEMTDIYASGKQYTDEGFYVLIARNRYGNEQIYRITVSRSFGVTSSVTFSDGHKIYYSKDYIGTLYSNGEITVDILSEGVTYEVTLNGAVYTAFAVRKEDGVTYLIFSKEGNYEIRLADSYGNVITRTLEINKSTCTVSDDLFNGFNDKALKRDEGYTNQKVSIDKNVFDSAGFYYLAIQYGDSLTVLFDDFSETSVKADVQGFVDVIGSQGDGVYTVICRNRYGAVVTKEIHYRGTPTLKLERTTRSNSEPEVYDLSYALSLGFWSNNTLSFSTDAKTYIFTINGSVNECPRTLVFDGAGEFGSTEYEITYIDEYGFEYTFKAYLVRKNITIELPSSVTGEMIDGILNTKSDILINLGENIYATYTRNNGEEIIYRSGDVLRKDGIYRFTVIDYAGNASTLTVKKDTSVEFAFIEATSGAAIQNGSVVNSSKVSFDVLNKDSAYIQKVLKDGVVQKDFTDTRFTEDGKWELIICDKLGNKAYFSFYIVTREKNGFAYTTPYEYHVTELWYDSGDGVKISYLNFIEHSDFNSSFEFLENGKYTVVMTSDVTGNTSTFEFTVNTNAPTVSLVGCNLGETTINDVSITGCKVGDLIMIYKTTERGEELVERIEVTSQSTKMPTVTDGGKYRIVVESEAGVATELTFVRKHVMNTAGSIFIMVVIGISVAGLFAGLICRNKSKTDD